MKRKSIVKYIKFHKEVEERVFKSTPSSVYWLDHLHRGELSKDILWKCAKSIMRPIHYEDYADIDDRPFVDGFIDFKDYQNIASPDWQIDILGAKRSWGRRSKFKVLGRKARLLCDKYELYYDNEHIANLRLLNQYATALSESKEIGQVINELNLELNQFSISSAKINKLARKFTKFAGEGLGIRFTECLFQRLGVLINPIYSIIAKVVALGLIEGLPRNTSNEYISLNRGKLGPIAIEKCLEIASVISLIEEIDIRVAIRKVGIVMNY